VSVTNEENADTTFKASHVCTPSIFSRVTGSGSDDLFFTDDGGGGTEGGSTLRPSTRRVRTTCRSSA
jgi:hypothetical protein